MAQCHVPAFLGDENGHYRVLVVGNSGSGKSTLASALAKELRLPYIPLDSMRMDPGWKLVTRPDFTVRVQKALDKCPFGWVVDGNCNSTVGPMLRDKATDIIWLDPPLVLYFPRIFWRTVRRIFHLEEPCSQGCYEDVWNVFFTSDSILWWCLSNHRVVRRTYTEVMSRIGLHVGSDVAARRMRRIGGWGGELKIWWQGVKKFVEEKTL